MGYRFVCSLSSGDSRCVVGPLKGSVYLSGRAGEPSINPGQYVGGSAHRHTIGFNTFDHVVDQACHTGYKSADSIHLPGPHSSRVRYFFKFSMRLAQMCAMVGHRLREELDSVPVFLRLSIRHNNTDRTQSRSALLLALLLAFKNFV